MRYLIIALFVTGCGATTNAYRDYYIDKLGPVDANIAAKLEPVTGPVRVIHGTSIAADNRTLLEQGYVKVGYSQFENNELTPAESDDMARSVAAERQASLVMLYDSDAGTATEQVDHTVDNPTVTTWTRTDAYGNEHSHSRTDDNYTTTTEDVDVARYNYTATFWAKVKPTPFGAYIDGLTPAQRTQLQRNTGVRVLDVIHGSPAFIAGVMPGDVLLAVDGAPIIDGPTLQRTVASRVGQTVHFAGLRDGKPIDLAVTLGLGPTAAR